jgi:hypothetical protein
MRSRLLAACALIAVLSLGACVVGIVGGVVGAAAKANFAGTWVLDVGKSEGIWQGTEQTLTVGQNGDRIDIELKVKTPQGERVNKDSYTVDGTQVEFAPPGTVGKGKRTVKWTADGSAIEISELYDAQTPEGTDTMKGWRRWSLSPDGKLLIIEQRVQTPNGLSQTKRVFVKQ